LYIYFIERYNSVLVNYGFTFEMQIMLMRHGRFYFSVTKAYWHQPTSPKFNKVLLRVGVRPFPELNHISDKIGWSDFRRGSSLPSVPSTAGTMFSKLKSGTSSVSQGAQVLSTNNILNLFEVGKFVCSAGPELIWKVYEGFRKPDGKVSHRRSVNMITVKWNALLIGVDKISINTNFKQSKFIKYLTLCYYYIYVC